MKLERGSTMTEHTPNYKEGDILVLFKQYHNQKRVVFCERLKSLSLQNKDEDGNFDDNIKGNMHLSTFSFLSHYEFEIVGFKPVKQSLAEVKGE